MLGRIELPTDKAALAKIIDQHADREEARLGFRRMLWSIAWAYLNGYRRFDLVNPSNGDVVYHFLDKEGSLEFMSQEMLSRIDRVVGRLLSYDYRPAVGRTGFSLAGLQKRAVAQIFADSAVSEDHLDSVMPQLLHTAVTLGMAGIQGHVIDMPTVGLTADLEVIHPSQLFAFPTLNQDYTRQTGLMRQRVIPFSVLAEKYGTKRMNANLNKMLWYEVSTGASLGENENRSSFSTSITMTEDQPGQQGSTPTEDETMTAVVKVRELWLDGPRGTCSRYVIASGDYVIEDLDFADVEVYCPIGIVRFIDNGSFYGAGMFDLLYSLVREMERMLKALFKNIRDLDRYGILVMPTQTLNEKITLRDVGHGLKVANYTADPLSEGFRPVAIKPFNTGDVPGRTAAFAKELLDSMDRVQDLIAEKGRVDSASGLAFLDEQINKLMTSVSKSLDHAMGVVYRAIVREVARNVAESPRPIPINRLSVDLAGVIIDDKDNSVIFPSNPLPDLSQLQFGIKESSPRSGAARIAQAIEMFKEGLMDPMEVRLFFLKEGFDVPMWLDADAGAYQSIIRQILLLYGDGETPGFTFLTPYTAKPALQLRVVEAFMSDIPMLLASPEVINEFKRFRETLMGFDARVLPEGMPNPDDMAMLTQIDQMAPMLPEGSTP